MRARASTSTSRRSPTGSAPVRPTLMPLVLRIRTHVFAAERIHADETTVPVLAKGKTRTGRLWTYVRDDRPFGGPDPPAAAFFYSPDRAGKHAEEHLAGYAGLMQADAFAGFNRLYEATRKGVPITEAMCWAHAGIIPPSASTNCCLGIGSASASKRPPRNRVPSDHPSHCQRRYPRPPPDAYGEGEALGNSRNACDGEPPRRGL